MDGENKDATNGAAKEAAGWQYKAESSGQGFAGTLDGPMPGSPADDAGVEWSASEFVAHDKGFGWYFVLMMAAILVAAILYFVTRDVIAAVVVIVMAIVLAIIGARKPRTITYHLDSKGLTAGNRFYPYRAYKSFAVPEDGPFASIVLVPLRRFDLPVSAYLAPDSQQRALEVLSGHLPMEQGKLDAVEQFMRRIRF